MEQIFKTKVRKIGTSLGVLIPKKLIKKRKIKVGEEIEIALLKRQKLAIIERAFGIAKDAKPFERESIDRV